MYSIGGCALLIATSFFANSAFAHHSSVGSFDFDKTITVQGTVRSYRLANPHTQIELVVKAPDGTEELWLAVGESASVLRRMGWDGSEIKIGDGVSMTGYPGKNGARKMEWISIVLPDGTEILGGNGGQEERERHLRKLDELRRSDAATPDDG